MTAMDDRLAQLRARFVARAIEDRRQLKQALAANDRASIRQIAHSLAGNGGIFGFPEITDAARAVEDALDEEASTEALRRLHHELDERIAALSEA